MIRKAQYGIWESDVRDLDLKKPDVLRFYVERKINVGDWAALDRQTVEQLLPELDLVPALHFLLQDFLQREKHYGMAHTSATLPSSRHRRK